MCFASPITSVEQFRRNYAELRHCASRRDVHVHVHAKRSPDRDTLSFAESRQLIIKNMNVPATVKASETDYVILDCDYDLENTSSKGLVVKWFFNNNEVAYQWIYGRLPLAAEPAAKYVDLLYKASDDPYTEYRAMKLNKPGIDLTGEYTCVISTFADERIANASMVVYGECPLVCA